MSPGEGSHKQGRMHAQAGWPPWLSTVCNRQWCCEGKLKAQLGLRRHAVQQVPGSHQTREPRMGCSEWEAEEISLSHTWVWSPVCALKPTSGCFVSRWDQGGENFPELDELSRSQSTCSPSLQVSIPLVSTSLHSWCVFAAHAVFLHLHACVCVCVTAAICGTAWWFSSSLMRVRYQWTGRTEWTARHSKWQAIWKRWLYRLLPLISLHMDNMSSLSSIIKKCSLYICLSGTLPACTLTSVTTNNFSYLHGIKYLFSIKGRPAQSWTIHYCR